MASLRLLSFGDIDDPIDYLKSISGDPEGREILAILIEVLEAGFVHVEIGTPEDTYVWPYFARFPPDGSSGPQMVELFKLLTAGDYEDMKIYGTYLFYRVGIGPDGVWKYLRRRRLIQAHFSLTAGARPGSVPARRWPAPVSSPSHMTRRPRTTVPTGQPVTVRPS